jgi:hypothetical protein
MTWLGWDRAVLERTGIDPALVEEVYLGCANQAGEDNRNVARMALLLAGLPVEVAGVTVNRLCASGLNAINQAARAIRAGEGEIYIAASGSQWLVADLQLSLAQLSVRREKPKEKFFPLEYRWLLEE